LRLAVAGADDQEDGPPHAQEASQAHSPHLGDSVLNKSLTIVLPVHNAESRLRNNVHELLEIASELTAKFGVPIIDDGSTDATLEVAEVAGSANRRHARTRLLAPQVNPTKSRISPTCRRFMRQWSDRIAR
jgi:hypothetical protein